MRKAGIRCPEVILLKKHILVLSFIGDHQKAAPKLKDAELSSDDLLLAYEQCTEVSHMSNFINLWLPSFPPQKKNEILVFFERSNS